MARIFTDVPAERDHVPLLIGLVGASSSGKTFSALRLATGIQQVSGGDIIVIDTEASRAKHYADRFKFRHVSFGEPFGSLDYLEAITQMAKKGAGVIVVDSMSHEHEGVGGYLATHESELTRIAGDDYSKRERCKMLAWSKPSQDRRRLINGILQLKTNFIFCFRAKEKIKPDPKKEHSKSGILELGYQAISGDEFIYEMTLNCLLPPRSNGVPLWKSDRIGEREIMKLPEQFKHMFDRDRQLDEGVGKELAEWARGGAKPAPVVKEVPEPSQELVDDARQNAIDGMEIYQQFFARLTKEERLSLTHHGYHEANKHLAAQAATQAA